MSEENLLDMLNKVFRVKHPGHITHHNSKFTSRGSVWYPLIDDIVKKVSAMTN